jgi:hypothetical protein
MEVVSRKTRATFFKDEVTGRPRVLIKAIGDPNSIIQKVEPRHIERFPNEWKAFEAGMSEPEIVGTPLMEVPGVNKDVALQMKLKGVRTAEELAALDDAACNAVGMGTLTFRKIARLLLQTKKLEAEAEMMPRRGRPPKTESEPAPAV